MWSRSGGTFDVDVKRNETQELEKKRLDPEFWSDPSQAQLVEKQISALKSSLDAWNDVRSRADDMETLIEMAAEEGEDLDDELLSEFTPL